MAVCLSSTEIGTFFTPYSMVTYFFQWLTIFHQQDSGASVDIGCGNAFGGEDDGGADDNAEKVNNVIDEVIVDLFSVIVCASIIFSSKCVSATDIRSEERRVGKEC